MDSRLVFDRNLAAIRKRSPQLAAMLASASCAGVEEVVGPRGAVVLRERGVQLGSAYDPVRDGQRMAESMASERSDIMVAIGFGLGHQFESFCERNPGTVIVYEPSLARLRAALERISIVNLLNTQRDFYIAADLDQFTHLLNARYVSGLRIRVFPHPAVLRLDPEPVASVVERIRRIKDAADTRMVTSIEMLMPWASIVAHNGRRIAESTPFSALRGAFANKPCVVVAAGPSLDKQLPVLREFRDRVAVIAIGQTLKALRQAGIEPDLVHILESRDVSHQLTAAGDTQELCLALSPDCHHAIFDVPNRACFAATVNSSPLATWIAKATGDVPITIGGGTVAQGAVGLAATMGANPIMLIGQDLAFTDGRAYAKGSAYDFVGVEMTPDGRCSFTNMKQKVGLERDRDVSKVRDEYKMGDVVWVDGWNEGEKLPTWRAYASFIEQYRDIGMVLANAGVDLINCTEGGARIPFLGHRRFREVLEEVPATCLEARRTILDRAEAHPKRQLEDYATALLDSRKKLDAVEEEVSKAQRFVRKKLERLRSARNDQQRVEVLRGLARHEKRIRRHLERMPWLDALVQPEIYNLIAATRRTERQDPGIEDLAEEAVFLFEAAAHGVERGREWFDAFEASFEASFEPSSTGAGEAATATPPTATTGVRAGAGGLRIGADSAVPAA